MYTKRIANQYYKKKLEELKLLEELTNNKGESSTSNYFATIKSIEAGALKITGWSLGILAGSIGLIIGSAHITPEKSNWKLIYLLFIIGWYLVARTFYHGRMIIQSSMAAEFHKGKEDALEKVFKSCNGLLEKQLKNFNRSLWAFGAWLIIYLIWWIIRKSPAEQVIKSIYEM